jgi:pyruvate-formate lyase-activating enzyme
MSERAGDVASAGALHALAHQAKRLATTVRSALGGSATSVDQELASSLDAVARDLKAAADALARM